MRVETFHLLKKLEAYPTFGVDSIANITGADTGYVKVFLNRLVKKGLIQKLQRNVYTMQKDPLVYASRITWPSYISLWSALRYHNLTEQLPGEISVLTTSAKSRKTISFMNVTIEFHRIRPEYFFGFTKVGIDGFEVFMAEPEKAVIDAVLLRKISFSEIYSILEGNSDTLSREKIVDYILHLNNAAVAKRLGWALDMLGYDIAEKLKPISYKTVIRLDYARPSSGKLNNKWGIDENIAVI